MGSSSALPRVGQPFSNKIGELPEVRSQGPLVDYAKKYSMSNWDGYNADPIRADTISTAELILASLPDKFSNPDIAPGADGTIGFEWIFDEGPLQKLFIDVGPGNSWSAYWQRPTGESKTVPPKQISPNTKSDLDNLIAELSV